MSGSAENRLVCGIPDPPRSNASSPMLKGCRCQCTACRDYFGSERAFDRHRVGNFAKAGDWRSTRRCLEKDEMRALGWFKDERGFWLTPDPRRAGARVLGPFDAASAIPEALNNAESPEGGPRHI